MKNGWQRLLGIERLEQRRTLDSEAPFVVSIVPPDSQPLVAVRFSEAVMNVDPADFALTRNGVLANDLILSGQWLSPTLYELELANFSDADFQLRLDALASDIQDLASNSIQQDATAAWHVDRLSPSWNFELTPAAQPAPRVHRVAALGDSMTLESTGSYVQFLRQQFSSDNFEALSFAGSGWKVETIRQVWETEVRDAGFDTIIVFAGLPNLTSSTSNADEIFVSLKSIYDDAIARGINVICINVCPWADYRKWTTARQTETDRLNLLIADYAQQHSQFLHYVNAYEQFKTLDEPTRLSPRFGIGDGVHFSAVGDRYLAELVTPILAGLIAAPPVPQTAWLQFSEPVTPVQASQVSIMANSIPIEFQLVPITNQRYRLDFQVSGTANTAVILHLDSTTITDLAGNAPSSQPAQEFHLDYQAPFVAMAIDQGELSHQAVQDVAITFSEAIVGLSVANFQLLKDRNPIDLSGALLEMVDAQRYVLHVTGLVGIDGNYELNFVPRASTTDSSGNALVRGASIDWVTIPAAPSIAQGLLTIVSTRDRDTIEIVVGSAEVTWTMGGVPNTIRRSGFDQIKIMTGGGSDYVSMRVLPGAPTIQVTAESSDGLDAVFMYDSTGDDVWQATPTSATLTAGSFQLTAIGFAQASAFSRSGADQALLFDSAGDDQMQSNGWVSFLQGIGFSNTALGFPQVVGQAAGGGRDVADFFDSPLDDTAHSTPTQASLSVPGYTYTAKDFDRVGIRATTGNDKATLAGSSAFENYVGQSSSSSWTGTGFAQYYYSFDEVQVLSGGGNDRAIMYDSSGNDRLEANSRMATLILPAARLTTIDFAKTSVYSRSGVDTATFLGRSVSETLVGDPTYAAFSAGGFSVYAYAFDVVSAVGNGGNDVATFYGSVGNDYYESRPNTATLSGAGYRLEATGFRRVNAYARTGTDQATLYSGAAVETLTAQRTSVNLTGPNNTSFAHGFDRVEAIGDAGDVANLYDSGGNDTFEAAGNLASMYGAGFYNQVRNFGRVNAFARAGNDSAILTGVPGTETFTGRPTGSSMVGTGFANYAYGFDSVTGRSDGGTDVAFLNDSAGNDEFIAFPTAAEMRGASYQIIVNQFSRVSAYASTGVDTARLTGNAGNDVYVGRPTLASLRGTQYFLLASGFDTVTTHGQGGNDTATFFDSTGDDHAYADAFTATMHGPGYGNIVNGFNKISFTSTSGSDRIRLSETSGDDTFTGQDTTGRLVGLGLNVSLQGFLFVDLLNSSLGLNRVMSSQLRYVLNVGLGWS